MIALCFIESFSASHALTGGDWGPEGERHSHNYRLEWEIRGRSLDSNGFLVDLVEVEARLKPLIERYSDAFLNDLPEFRNLNPSLERFAQAFFDGLREGLAALGVESMCVRLWEHEKAWAAVEGTV